MKQKKTDMNGDMNGVTLKNVKKNLNFRIKK